MYFVHTSNQQHERVRLRGNLYNILVQYVNFLPFKSKDFHFRRLCAPCSQNRFGLQRFWGESECGTELSIRKVMHREDWMKLCLMSFLNDPKSNHVTFFQYFEDINSVFHEKHLPCSFCINKQLFWQNLFNVRASLFLYCCAYSEHRMPSPIAHSRAGIDCFATSPFAVEKVVEFWNSKLAKCNPGLAQCSWCWKRCFDVGGLPGKGLVL